MSGAAQTMTAVEVEIVQSLDSSIRPLALRHRAAVLALGIPYTFISGRRSRSQQAAEVVRQGRTTPAAPAGQSKHELGMAWDATGPRTPQEWQAYGQQAEELGLKWGGRFHDAQGHETPDPQHVEVPTPRDQLAGILNFKLFTLAAVIGLTLVIAADTGGSK